MRATWEELPQRARTLILARRHDNVHARGLYRILVEEPAERELQAWIEYVADAQDDPVVLAALYRQRFGEHDDDPDPDHVEDQEDDEE